MSVGADHIVCSSQGGKKEALPARIVASPTSRQASVPLLCHQSELFLVLSLVPYRGKSICTPVNMQLCIKNVGFTNDGKTKTIQGRHDHLQVGFIHSAAKVDATYITPLAWPCVMRQLVHCTAVVSGQRDLAPFHSQRDPDASGPELDFYR